MPDSTAPTGAHKRDRLTARELEILALVASGLSTADIGKQLGVAPGTVKAHLTTIFRKTGASNRVQAARYYLDHLQHDAVPKDIAARPRAAMDDAQSGEAPAASGRSAGRWSRRGALTRRELQVLELVGAGEPTPAISRKLGLSEATIKTFLNSIYKKTGAQNRVQAARYYLRHHADATEPSGNTDRDEPPPTLPNLEQHINDLEARLAELQPAVREAQRIQRALEALQGSRTEPGS